MSQKERDWVDEKGCRDFLYVMARTQSYTRDSERPEARRDTGQGGGSRRRFWWLTVNGCPSLNPGLIWKDSPVGLIQNSHDRSFSPPTPHGTGFLIGSHLHFQFAHLTITETGQGLDVQ